MHHIGHTKRLLYVSDSLSADVDSATADTDHSWSANARSCREQDLSL